MSQYPSMPLFTGDMLQDTAHLSNEEFGAYHRLLYAMWQRNGWVPDDDRDLARICHMGIRHWQRMKPRFMQFLISEDGELSQKKLLKVRAKCDLTSTKMRENINKRWHPDSKENKDIADTNVYTKRIHRARDSNTNTKESFILDLSGGAAREVAPRRRTNDWDMPPAPGPNGKSAFLKNWKLKQ